MHSTDVLFGKAEEKLESILEIRIPVDSAERIEERLGKSSALVLDNLSPIDRDTEAEILVQTSDNKGIPMVRPSKVFARWCPRRAQRPQAGQKTNGMHGQCLHDRSKCTDTPANR
jgi:hypothetical protein